MNKPKVVTLCGSMKYQHEMAKIALELELEKGYIVIQCVYSDGTKKLTLEDVTFLNNLHYQKIDISDAIYVVNVNGYVGSTTSKEIEYAKKLGKEILSLEPLDK